MILRYNLPDGKEEKFKLEKPKITIGRGLNVDLTINDPLVSRLHCSLEFKDGAWYLHDLNSRNGTYVNTEPVKTMRLAVGDRLRIGETILTCDQAPAKGAETVMRELKDEMDSGKGFRTMMIEIVGNGKEEKKKKGPGDFGV